MSFTDGNPSNRLKFEDTSLKMQRAGKLKPIGDRAECCLQEIPSPPTPPAVRIFRNSILPEPGAIRVHHGKANDPDVAITLVHGIKTKTSVTSESLFNAPGKSFQQKWEELKELVYAPRKNSQLGRSCEQHGGLPAWYDEKTTFGVKTNKGQDIRELINPPKTAEELKQEAQEGHVSVRSHSSDFVGDKIDRKYNRSHFDKDAMFGLQTPHSRDGRNVGKSLRWLGEPLKFYNPNPAWKRSGTKEKLAEQNGVVTRERKNVLNLPPEHTFGVVHSPDKYGIREVLYRAEPGQEKQHDNVSAVRNQLKTINFNNFPSLLKAFQHYDKKGKGSIDRDDLRSVCQEFHLNVNEVVLDGLMDLCDTDRSGLINFVAFGNFLTWKDKMPIGRRDQRLLTGERPVNTDRKQTSAEHFSSEALVKPEDLEPIKPGSSLKTIRTIRTARTAPGHFLTSAALIGADRDKLLTSNGRTFGIRSVHSAPRTSKAISYSNICTAADLLHPSIYALHGVHEEDLRCPRTKEEIAEIFGNTGVNISEETFEEAWKLASMKHPSGDVCIEVFRTTLKDIKAI